MACGVFAYILSLSHPFFFFAYLLGLCLCYSRLVLLAAWLLLLVLSSLSLWVVVSFSLTDVCAKRKGAIPCVLSCPVVGLLWVYYMLSAFLSVDSFAFENIHPAPQVRRALNLPPRVFKVSLIARVSPIIAIAFSE